MRPGTRLAHRRRSGFALIDAVLSLAILAIATTGLIALLRQTVLSVHLAAERDRTVRAAGTALAGLSVRDATWLDQRIGDSRYQSWALRIERLTPSLYRTALADTVTGKVWVETTWYFATPGDTSAAQ